MILIGTTIVGPSRFGTFALEHLLWNISFSGTWTGQLAKPKYFCTSTRKKTLNIFECSKCSGKGG